MKYKPEELDIKRLREDLIAIIAPLIKLQEEEHSPILINTRLDLDYAIAFTGNAEKLMEISYRYDINLKNYLL